MRIITSCCVLLVILVCISGQFMVRKHEKRAAQKTLWELLKDEKSVSWFYSVAKQTYMKRILESRQMTVFIPTNAAYQKLSTKLKRLLKYNLNRLYYVILYHFIIDAIYPSRFMADGMMLPVGLDKRAFLNVRRNSKKELDIWIQGKKFVKKDIKGRNGIMHIIDGVLFPSENSLIDLMDNDRDSDIMKSLINRANFVLPTGYTLFTPHDEAFNQLTNAGLEKLRRNRRAARLFVSKHIVPKPIFMSSVMGNGPMAVRTLAGSTISLIPTSEGVYINIQGSSKKHVVKVDKSDLMVVNGVVHSVEHVLTANEALLKVKERKPATPRTFIAEKQSEGPIALRITAKEVTTAAPTTKAPTTLPPTTKEVTTTPPATKAPTTLPPTTKEVTTAPPVTEGPTTVPPTTIEVTTAPPVTEAPTTLPPTTKEVTTAPLVTEAPTTLPPTTKEVTTAPPVTEEPTTLPPTTKEVTTAPPVTEAPTTLPPTTKEVTTAPPVTEAPTTLPPTTKEVTTAPPVTEEPTTLPPTTKEVTTAPPVTEAPTTLPPTTKEVTTAPPTTEASTTAPPTPKEDTTAPPVTEAPTTLPTTTKEVTTAPPTTEAPTTLPPTTKEVTKAPPTTEAPTTFPPTTKEVTTAQTTTEEPTTLPLTTKEVTTAPPTTEEQTTRPLTTKKVTTAPPTTEAPTTRPPTRKEVTTAPTTTEEPTSLPLTTTKVTTAPSAKEEPTTKPKEPTTKPEEATAKPEVPTTKPEEPTTKPEEATAKPEVPTTKPEEPTTKQEEPTTKAEVPTKKAEVPTRKPVVPTTKREEPTTKPEEITTKAEVPTTKAEVPTTKAEVPTTKPEVPTTKAATQPSTPAPPACTRNSIPFCKNIFNFTTYPNSFKDKRSQDIWSEIKQIIPMIKIGCSVSVIRYMCSIYTPPCVPGEDSKVLKPCRSLCSTIRESCIGLINNVKLAEIFDCSKLPAESEGACYGIPGGKKDTKVRPTTQLPNEVVEKKNVRQKDYKEPILNLRETLIKNDLTEFLKYIMEFEDLRPILTDDARKYTLFAPTNEAFYNLNGNSKKSFTGDRTYRRQIIRYHIVPREIKTMGQRFRELKTLSGNPLIVRSYDKRRMADHAFILSHDGQATNGRINIIDRLMIPYENHLASVLTNREEPSVSLFRKAVMMTGMLDTLKRKTRFRYILWVPTDDAFLKLSKETLQYMFTNMDVLRNMVDFHLTPGYFHTNLMTTRWVYVFRTRIPGVRLRVRKLSQAKNGLMVYNTLERTARSVLVNLGATNGIVNLIDTVLFPPNIKFPDYAKY